MKRNAFLLAAAGLTASLMTSVVLAAPVTPATVTVSDGDLDLLKDAGVEQLYTRLRRAARSVCGPDADIRDFAATASRNACITAALEGAVAATHNSRLSARARALPSATVTRAG